MRHKIGPQYENDDDFRKAARLHQSRYRAEILKVGFDEYGNRLTESDGRNFLNYYDRLGVRQVLQGRFPRYSRTRDADMLRSEHIPFNLFAPLTADPDLAQQVLGRITGIGLRPPVRIEFEWAPEPAEKYLGDRTAFDTYIAAQDEAGHAVGIGIEVKYTERGYELGKTEALRVNDPTSTYWTLTRNSGVFTDDRCPDLATDDLRQIWRNHLLGRAMQLAGDIDHFASITLYPPGNRHMGEAISRYRRLLTEEGRSSLLACTFEDYIAALSGNAEIQAWQAFLRQRYLVGALEDE